jgi:hypothetical protein
LSDQEERKMTRIIAILAAAALVASGSVALAQATGQAGAQASGGANVQANGTSTQASGSASAGTSAKQSEQSGSLAAGTAMSAQLNESVDSKKAKQGDPVTARTTEAVKSDGKVVIPKGTKLVGHVTRASARAKGDADSALAVQFNRAVLKDGHEMPLQVTIQALAAAQSVAAVSGEDLQPMSGAQGRASGSGTAGGRGVAGGATSTVGSAASGAASTVPRATQDASGAVNSTVGGAANTTGRAGAGLGTGLNAAGELTSTSRGVFGLDGVSLNGNAANSTEGSVITSAGKNLHLDSGTRMLLVTQAATSASAQR